MQIQEAYNEWAAQYDTNLNKTRDAEAHVLREALAPIPFEKVLELGCGTGKNTVWLMTKAAAITAVDFSGNMLEKARARIDSTKVQFYQADMTLPWDFASPPYDLAVCSLVLEHIEDLDSIFKKLSAVISNSGYVYLGELHPFRQYTGSGARFVRPDGEEQTLTCFTHHISDFMTAATTHGFRLVSVREYFDEGDRSTIPRLLAMVWQKN
jgi:ubiquinone/menaquinone biosynthesis C-methylase UbiE